MASHNTKSDSANTAVRAFLTKLGAKYYGKSYNHSAKNSKAKEVWISIKEVDFKSLCAYCNEKPEKLQMEHVYMLNQKECGLHHPGNTIPACASCNGKVSTLSKDYDKWDERLREHCTNNLDSVSDKDIDKRIEKIEDHMKKYKYPIFTQKKEDQIKQVAQTLFREINNICEAQFEYIKKTESEIIL